MHDIEKVWKEMNSLLGDFGDVVIAGGAVRDFLMERKPKDYDVFILNTSGYIPTFTEVADLVRKATELSDYKKVEIKYEWHKSEPFLIESIVTPYGEVQIMARDIQTQADLIDTFDWNVARFSYGRKGFLNGEDVANIGVGKNLELHKVTYPYSTLRRGYRFSERFTMRFQSKDVRTICNMIVEKEKENQKRKDALAEFSVKILKAPESPSQPPITLNETSN